MDDSQLLRYSRHIFLDELGVEGQQKLLGSHVLIVGAGGLGSPAALYLGSAGVGHITVVDHDTVDVTNLQRQIAHSLADVGCPKAQSIQRSIAGLNTDVQVSTVVKRATSSLLDALVQNVDVVLDCTDNFATRHLINRACVQACKPLVSGAAIRFDGQVTVYDFRHAQAPCYACVFPESSPPVEAQCSTMGVFAPLVGIIGSVQAAEALKLLVRAGSSLSGRLLMLDALNMSWSEMQIIKNSDCKVCGGH